MYKIFSYHIFNSIYSNKIYKFMIWSFLIIMCFFTTKKYFEINALESIGLIITDANFLCLCFFEFSFLISKKISDEFDNNYYIKIRFNDYNNYNNEKIKANFLCQSIYFCLIVVVIIIMNNFISLTNYSIIYIEQFKMNSLIFSIYSLLKIYLFTILLSTININLFNNDKTKMGVYIFNIILYLLILLNVYLNTKTISTFLNIFIGNSIVTTIPYENYYYDISNYIFHMTILILILGIVRRVMKK